MNTEPGQLRALGWRASLGGYKATGLAQVRYTMHNMWLAECNIAGMTCALYPLRCRSRLLTVPKSCQLLCSTEDATPCPEECQRSCKVSSNPSPGWLVSLRARVHHRHCSLTNLDKSTFLMAGILCISLLLEVILYFSNFGFSPWIQPSCPPSPLQMLAKPSAASRKIPFRNLWSVFPRLLNISVLAQLPIHLERKWTAKINRHTTGLLLKAFQCCSPCCKERDLDLLQPSYSPGWVSAKLLSSR